MANRRSQKHKPIKQFPGSQTTKKEMKSASSAAKSIELSADIRKPIRWLVWGGALTTLAMWLSLNDPFNAPKSWVLSTVAVWLFVWTLFNFRTFTQNKILLQASAISLAFLSTLFIAWLATDNKFTGLFGLYGRKTGFLAYFSFIVFFLVAAYLLRMSRLVTFERTVVFLGLVLGIYGFFQHYKIDFVKWNNLYNSVLSTLGNPDFAGAIMAILLVLNFGIAIRSTHVTWFRAIAGFNVALLVVVIIFSQARQGLLAAALGVAFITNIWIYQRQKRAAYILGGLSVIAGLFVVAAMLKMGPLSRFFYKDSVTYRGDYWRAAFRMFLHHPFFGVGLDRYGAYFRQYRDATETLRRGPMTVADAAHDVPLQLAATGGILVLLSFLALVGFILWRGVVALRKTKGTTQLLVAGVFGAWLTYEAQSLISLDNIGIAIWGYILGGAVVGLSLIGEPDELRVPPSTMGQPIISMIGALLLVVLSFLFFQSERATHSLLSIIPPKDPALIKEYESFVNKPLTYLVKEPSFEFAAAQDYRKVGDNTKAIQILTKLVSHDPRNIDALSALSDIYTSQKNWPAAIATDKKMVKLDPFNQVILLKLGQDEKSSGDSASARQVIGLINAFAPNSTEAKQAASEFGR